MGARGDATAGGDRPGIEVLRPGTPARPPRFALFDFDGTLSLIREGWPDVMIPMMVEILAATGGGEARGELEALVRTFVMELTGKQTIYQMLRLAEEVRERGGNPDDPLAYKAEYHRRLLERVGHRREGLRSGTLEPSDLVVPGTFELLEALAGRGVALYLASGTDVAYVREEAALLGLDRFFGERCYGAVDRYRTYSKAKVIEAILADGAIDGTQLVGFGDGYVEIENVKGAGGFAVAVASNESARDGTMDPWKRERLARAGADIVIPDFRHAGALVSYVWGEERAPLEVT